jgi:type I restriction enzyme S subunit
LDLNSKLSDICFFVKDKIKLDENQYEGKITLNNYISTENLLPNKRGKTTAAKLPETSSINKFSKNDILVSNIRPYFKKIWFANIEGGCSTDTLIFRAEKNIDPSFLYYILSSDDFFNYATLTSKGTKMPRGDKTAIMNFEVPDFSLEDQTKIGKILSKFDKKLETNNQINKNLEEQIHLIFKNWFVDFQPFKNCKFKNSSFGEIPKEWKIYDFKDFLKIRVEKSNKQNIPKFSITNNGIQNRDEKFKKNLSSPSSKFKLVYKNDLIFGMSREILNWGLMNDEIGGVSSAYNVFIIEKLNPRYLESFIKHRIVYFKDIIKPASREGQGIDKNILFDKQIYVPPNNIIEDYYRIEDKFVNLINNNNKEIDNLASLRDILIHKLISGEVDVSNVEI